ncbi:MAG: glycosyltransferase family 61 protein [Clostridia bacterium]|nr:glycosyltransferase family 61 protein [Clostridia bacterium]
MINIDYLYDFNKDRYSRIYEKRLDKVDNIEYIELDNAVVLPAKNDDIRLFGLGGVIDKDDKYVKSSGIYSRGRFLSNVNDEEINVFGGKYEFNKNDIEYSKKKSIYLGYITNHWGHFLVDFSTRLWYVLENREDVDYIFVVKENQRFELIKNIKRFLELLGINLENIKFINKPTCFEKIIVPQVSYFTNKYYSEKYLKVFDKVCESVNIKNEKINGVYFSRNSWYKAQESEIGEDLLIDLFQKNGYKIIAPEKCTLDEQISYIRNSEVVVGVAGTIPHNMLFANDKQKMIIINKTYNFNSMQKDINIMKNLDAVYIDSYISILPVPLGNGTFLIIYNENMKKFIQDNQYTFPDKMYQQECFNIKLIKKYKRLLRQTGNIKHVNYIEDSNNSGYFEPGHLIYYYKNFYYETEPIKVSEKIIGKFSKIKMLIGKIRFKLKNR